MSAANNIEAHSKTLKDLLKERKYKVKYFQREYKWGKNHIEDLLVDLERSFFSNYTAEHTRDDVPDYDCYYMGPVVLYREKSAYIIVDGQQRLTSFTLLLIYLSHLQNTIFGENSKKTQKLNEYIYSQPYEKETFNLEIKEREDILRCLYENCDIDEAFLENESSRNIYERYHDIIDLFPNRIKKEEVLPIFINWLVGNLIFIEILAQTSDSAYTIFETMNDRGLNLTQSELLKSYLLSNVMDDSKIKDLDQSWKSKIAHLKTYSKDEDLDFFKAWLRGKYAITLKGTEKNSLNEDFEKIGNRFSNWVQENDKRLLELDKSKPESYYFFVNSDFHFYSDIYIKLSDLETSEDLPEHRFKLISYKGISQSLSYPFVLAPIQKIDPIDVIEHKINTTTTFLDCFAIYRLFQNLPITQSSIDYAIYNKIKSIRNSEISSMTSILKEEIDAYRKEFLNISGYLPFDSSYSKYILSRLYKMSNPEMEFDTIYFQRKKESYILYQFLSINDSDNEVHKINQALRAKFIDSLCSFCLIPRQLENELNKMSASKKITYLIKNNYLPEFKEIDDFNPENLQDFFIKRDKKLKDKIYNSWKL